MRTLAAQAQESARIQEERGQELKQALMASDMEAPFRRVREAMWEPLLQLFKQTSAVANGWNRNEPPGQGLSMRYIEPPQNNRMCKPSQ